MVFDCYNHYLYITYYKISTPGLILECRDHLSSISLLVMSTLNLSMPIAHIAPTPQWTIQVYPSFCPHKKPLRRGGNSGPIEPNWLVKASCHKVSCQIRAAY